MNMPMITQFQENQKTMSTRVIADLTEKRHDHVKRDVENMLGQLGLDIPKFGGIYFDAQNRQQTEYLLDEELTMTLVTGYNIVLRNRVIKRWKELEDKASKPVELSRMELIQLALAAEQENQALKDHVAMLAPKAQALDTIADTSNTYCIRECAKTIGIKESELIQLLIDKKWVYRDASKKLHDGQERVFLHMRVTAFGLTRITGLVEKSRMKGDFVA